MRTAWALIGGAALAALLAPIAVSAQDTVPLKKIVVSLPFDEAELIVKSEAQRQNLNLVSVLDIQKGMQGRGETFRPYRIYQFCNLDIGMRIFADSPDYGAFALCTVLMYEVDAGHTALVSARQTRTLEGLPDHRPGPAALAAARRLERIIDDIFGAVVEESKARSR